MKTLYQPGVASEIEDRVARLKPGSPRQWGKMTPAQMTAHCAAAMQLALGELRPRRQVAGHVIGWAIKVIVIGNDRPLRPGAPAPSFLVMTDDRDLDAERRNLIEVVQRFAASGRDGCTGHPHPFFGRLTPEEWSNLMYKHLDHHLRQFSV
jgi:hypothetical protein